MAKKKAGKQVGERGGNMARYEELSVEELEALRAELKDEYRRYQTMDMNLDNLQKGKKGPYYGSDFSISTLIHPQLPQEN